MSTFNGLPAHTLINHFVVVLAPLTAVLAILCALWPAARRRLVALRGRVLVIVAAVTTLVQSYRIGDSGARAGWGNVTSSAAR